MDKKQHIAIFTTASLPWMTGTAVNPLFRAAYLSKDGERKVTLVIPWLSLKEQVLVYPSNITFRSPSEQEKYVRQWLEERAGFASCFSIRFYPGRFSRDKRSILAVGDISEIIPDEEADIAVLEEPEHLTWFHHGKRWKVKFRLVVGIIHTNYMEYVKREKSGMQASLLKYANTWVVNIYCHMVIRLSAATQEYPNSMICNVHGVNPKFLEIGKKKIAQQQNGKQTFTKGAYYIGKMVWSKGYKELLKLLRDHQKELAGLEVDLYGSGEDSDQVQEAAKKLELTVGVQPGRDHSDPLFHDYKVFLNPSTTDVVCTTTAEALAMGKIVVCANHPSNEFFKQFPNCWTYDSSNGFVEATRRALAEEPGQLTDAHRHELSWESATERFLKVADYFEASRQKTIAGMSPAAGINVPLLPEHKPKIEIKHATLPGAVFNVATSIIGAGIMSIPATLKVLGVIPAFLLIVIIAMLADVSVEFLMRFTHSGHSRTYAGVMRESFGRGGAVAAQVCVMVTNLGCLIMYLIIIGDVLSGNQPEGVVHLGILQQWFGIHWWNSREFALLVTVVFIMLPLVLFRRVESLKFSSAISVLLAIVFVGISSAMAISALLEGKTETPRMLPHLDNQVSFFDLFTAVPVIVTAFTFHFNVHPIGFELGKPSDMITACRISLALCAAIYFAIGLFGYLLFGDSIMPDILVNFDQNAGSAFGSLLNQIVRLSYALHIMLVFPLLNFSLRANIDEFLFPKKPLLATDTKRFLFLTLVLLAISYLAAIVIPNIWYFFQFLGSTSAVCLAFIFPGAIVIRDVHGISTSRDRIVAAVMIILAVVTSTIAISTNIFSLF